MEMSQEDPELVFENDIYVITVKVMPGEEILRVEAEQKSDGAMWRGDFTSGYIEDITKKTGNCKKFSVFVKMLRSAILQDSDSVFVSLLTYYELEVLKARKTNATQISKDSVNNKRYLILTYVGEFDRVHYPLPLLFEDIPESENLRRTIQRLKAEMKELKSKLMHRRNESSRINDFSSETNGHDCSRFEAEKALLVKEIYTWKSRYKALASKYEAKKECHKDIQVWRRKIEQLQEELRKEKTNHKKLVANMMVEKMSLLEEVRHCKDGETRARVRLRESESELEHLKRKMKATSARELPPARTRNRAAPNSTSNSRRPSPLQSKDCRSSSCPTFGSRRPGYREQGTRQTFVDHLIPRCLPRTGRRSPQAFVTERHTRGISGGNSSCSERSSTPPFQSSAQGNSCVGSPGRMWRNDFRRHRTGVHVDAEPKRTRKEHTARQDSPGKLLREVKEKLAKYAMMDHGSDRLSLVSATTCNETEDDTQLDTSNHQCVVADDCSDIEARIEALQNFLAKTK